MERNIIKLKERYSIAEALMTLAEERLVAVPVVNDHGILLGVIEVSTEIDSSKFDDFTHGRMKKKATKDFYQILGISIEQHRKGLFPEYCSRMPWLLGNIAAVLICAFIIFFYGHMIAGALILTMFIPLVLTLCESIALQAMVNTSYYLKHPKIPWKILLQRAIKELSLAVFIAITAAVVTGLFLCY